MSSTSRIGGYFNDPGLATFVGQGRIVRVCAVEPATELEDDSRCPSCRKVVSHLIVFRITGPDVDPDRDVCSACCNCYVRFDVTQRSRDVQREAWGSLEWSPDDESDDDECDDDECDDDEDDCR